MIIVEDYFKPVIDRLPASRLTKSYIVGLFSDQALGRRVVDLSTESIILRHISNSDGFVTSQVIADYALWALSCVPESMMGYERAIETVGRLNYARCYRQMPDWRLFQELADMLPVYARTLAGDLHL